MNTKTLFPIVLAVGIALISSHAATISINLTESGAPTETGYTNWESADNNLPSNLGVTLGSDSLILSVQPTEINAGTTLRSIDRGGNDGYAGPLANLTRTWWGQRASSNGPGGFITIDIAGLSAGEYSFTGWHLDHEDQTGIMKIELSTDDGASYSDAATGLDLVNVAGGGVASPTENATAPVVSNFNFTSTGADVKIRFTNTSVDGVGSGGAFSLMNGFEITQIPEPSSVALLGLAGGFLALRRRR